MASAIVSSADKRSGVSVPDDRQAPLNLSTDATRLRIPGVIWMEAVWIRARHSKPFIHPFAPICRYEAAWSAGPSAAPSERPDHVIHLHLVQQPVDLALQHAAVPQPYRRQGRDVERQQRHGKHEDGRACERRRHDRGECPENDEKHIHGEQQQRRVEERKFKHPFSRP